MPDNLLNDFEPKFSGFHDLMKFRVREILLVSSLYDAFVLEEDGRLAEKIFSEYIDLNLHFIPRITKVSSAEKALEALQRQSFDLVITMARISDMDPVEFGRKVKEIDSEKKVVLLTYDIILPSLLQSIRASRSIDKVFYWTGESKLLLSIIKYVEDMKNAPEDSRAGVQIILIIEDSPKHVSFFLPEVYTQIMTQTRILIGDGVNDLHRMLRMRARPKIRIADTFEEGLEIYEKYKHNLLGIISDVRFPKADKLHPLAGVEFARMAKQEIFDLPILLQTAEQTELPLNGLKGVSVLDKNSPNLMLELIRFIKENFGFGNFIFRMPDGREIDQARNLNEFAEKITRIPAESLDFHARRNHISIWLRARTEFDLADELRPKKVSDFGNIEGLRTFISDAFRKLLRQMQQGVIKDFGISSYYTQGAFVRLGPGSLGGKGRGLAFINALLANTKLFENFSGIEIRTPQTFAIGTEIFEEFIEKNKLQEFAIREADEDQIAGRFLAAPLPGSITENLKKLLAQIDYPLAVRSSSLMEDSQQLPFAGLYKTYMLPNNHPDPEIRLQQLQDAIRQIYASVYAANPKEYARHTDFRIEEERMAIIIQQLAGHRYGDIFYPVISGVAQSYNYYPISSIRPQDGIVHLALGLGRLIAEGEQVFRFSPAHPQINFSSGSARDLLMDSQNQYLALDLQKSSVQIGRDENITLRRREIASAEAEGTLFFVGSSYSAQDEIIKDTLSFEGPRVVTFANILKYNIFPLAAITSELLSLGESAFASPVEIEFAANLFRDRSRKPEFHILQIRPMVTGGEDQAVLIPENQLKNAFCASRHPAGNGIFREITDLIYVKPEKFSPAQSAAIAREVEQMNAALEQEERSFILIGFGRWGTRDPWLGIPVEWHQISQAQVIVEANLPNFRVEPSLGSHFFHNLISRRLGYMHIGREQSDEFIDWDWLAAQPSLQESGHLRHLRLNRPFTVKLDARNARAAVFRPGELTHL
ncbi:MAG: PEP/pyruvate-binding domain-containing protein [Calditrichia bacterium]